MSWWSSAFAPGVIAAGVTLAANWWLQRPRADLRMVRTYESAEDLERLLRANDGSPQWQTSLPMPTYCVRLANYGDGTAFDVKLSGEECQPRVWVGDTGVVNEGQAAVRWPIWSDTLAALEPGESVNVLVMCEALPPKRFPVIRASWPRLPGRRLSLGKSIECDMATARRIEAKWPGGQNSI